MREETKSYTDINQSKKLAKILPLESADMWYEYLPQLKCMSLFPSVLPICHLFVNEVPCWSLAALMSVLPKVHGLKPVLDLKEYSIRYGINLYTTASNPIDACYEMILKLHELKKN